MSTLRIHFSVLLLLALLTSCASHYRGPLPDFSLKGAEQVREIKKFELDETFEGQGLFFLMGPKKEDYTLASITPIIRSVSEEAYEKTHAGQMTYAVSMIVASTFGALAIWAELNDHRKWAFASAGTGLLIASYGGISIHLANQESARTFNKQIHKKFTPAVSYKKEF